MSTLDRPRVLALGNTASVLPTLATVVPGLYVAFPTGVRTRVLQGNERCFGSDALNFPLSVSCYKFVRTMANRFDVFHAELGYAVACRASRVPYGVHIHGVTDIDLLFPKTALGGLLKRRYRDALNGAGYVVCHPAVLDRIRSIRSDAKEMPLAVDTRQFNPEVPGYEFDAEFPIFSPSRMDQWKGHEVYWEALRLMRNREKVTVYQSDWGWEPYYSKLKASAPPNVRFVPVVPRESIASRYRGSKFVLGQLKIGHFGMTELEAAACGKGVLVRLDDRDSPFLPKSADPGAIAELMDTLVDDSAFREGYGDACRRYVLPRVGLESIAARFSRTVAESESLPPEGGRMGGLFLGSSFEVAGRLMGDRTFATVKAALIGL